MDTHYVKPFGDEETYNVGRNIRGARDLHKVFGNVQFSHITDIP
jgi:hypothetical protein